MKRLLSTLLLLPVPALADAPLPVQAAVERALSVADAQVEVATPEVPCAVERAEVQGAVEGSGRVAVRLHGDTCPGWIWAEVKVWAEAQVTTRAVRAGEPLAEAVRSERREVRAGRSPLPRVAGDAVADRALPAGTVIEPRHVRSQGPAAGDAVRVVLQQGAIRLEQPGRAVPCARGRGCAVLPSGKRVEGTFAGDRLLVELP